jgi:hypothetical protein
VGRDRDSGGSGSNMDASGGEAVHDDVGVGDLSGGGGKRGDNEIPMDEVSEVPETQEGGHLDGGVRGRLFS